MTAAPGPRRGHRWRVWLPISAAANGLCFLLWPAGSILIDRVLHGAIRPVLLHGPSRWLDGMALPFAELLALGLTGLVLWPVLRAAASWRRRGAAWQHLRRGGWLLLGTAAVLLHLFLLGFGYLYRGTRVENRRSDLAQVLEPARAEELALELAQRTAALRAALPQAASPRTLDELSAICHQRLLPVLAEMDLPAPPVLRAKPVWPPGLLLAFGVQGITPFLPPEAIVDTEVDALVLPMLVAHELAHVAGVAHEDDAEFVAWLALAAAEPDLAYAAHLSMSFRLERWCQPEARERFLAALGTDARADRQRVLETARRARVPWLDRIAGWIHESYLQGMGVGEGVGSYDHAAELVLRHRAGRE